MHAMLHRCASTSETQVYLVVVIEGVLDIFHALVITIIIVSASLGAVASRRGSCPARSWTVASTTVLILVRIV